MHKKDQKVIYMQNSVAVDKLQHGVWNKKQTHLLLVEQKGFHVTINK